MTHSPLFEQGLLKVKENDHHGAIEIFTAVLKDDPKNADALSQRAVAYLNLEQYELSMADMDLAIEYDPDYSYRYQCRGFLRSRMKDHEGAVKDYEKAVELDPNDGIAYNNLALVQEQMGYAKQSKRNFEHSDKLMGIKPRQIENAETEENKAKIEAQQKETDTTSSQPEKREIAKAVFTKKSAFKEFIQFIRNGFKLKENE